MAESSEAKPATATEQTSSNEPVAKPAPPATAVSTEQKEEEEKSSKTVPSPQAYPPNSINEAKAKYMKSKHRESHKYEAGQRSPKKRQLSTQQYINQAAQRVVSKAEEMKQQFLPQIEQTGNKLLHATDDAVKSLSASTGISFAPINIPLKRRRQTFAVLVWSSLYFVALALNFIAFRYWTGWKFYLYILYLCWKLMYQTFHKDGGLPIPWLRNAIIWRWFCDFFPIRLHKLYDLDDSGETSYLFGYHPHGIIGMGAVSTFAMSGASGFHKLFPGVDVRLLTLRINFFIPFFDLLITFMGICDASRESCTAILGDQEERKSLCLVLGGAKESLEANPGAVKLFLQKRKGFVKVALENGASLVPVFGFGENELFEQVNNPQGSLVRKIQNQLQNRMGFAIPLFHGRGIFQYNYGLLPKRRPIDVVFGKPIACPKMTRETITPDIIEKYHTIYCQELKALFDQEKHKYYQGDKDKLPEMIFI